MTEASSHVRPLASSSLIDDGITAVEQHNLTSDMQSYIRLLAKTKSFAKDVIIDSHNVPMELGKFWPKLVGKKMQAIH